MRVFGDEPSETLLPALLAKATARAIESGGRPTRAVRRLWKRIAANPRIAAALAEVAPTPERLAEWLALVGRDEGLERLLGAGGVAKSGTTIVAENDVPEAKPSYPVPDVTLRKRSTKGASVKPKAIAKRAAGSLWPLMSKTQRAEVIAAVETDLAAGIDPLAEVPAGAAPAAVTAPAVSDSEIAALRKQAVDMSDPSAMFAARQELQKRAAAAVTDVRVGVVPGVRARQWLGSGYRGDGSGELLK
jgi:hypothetical protein